MKNVCVFEYCNFGKGYLRVLVPQDKTTPAREIMIELDDYLLEDGMIKNIKPIADRLRHELKMNKIPPILLLLRCEETYKTILSLPTMREYKARALYAKELKMRNANSAYLPVYNEFHHSLGYVFNTYYLPKNVIDSFKRLAKILGTKISNVKLFGMYLNDTLTYGGSFVYFYIRKKVCTMLLVVKHELVSVYDFEFKDQRDIRNQFLLVASKHEFELEHKQIRYYEIDSDEDISIELGLVSVKDRVTVGQKTPRAAVSIKKEPVFQEEKAEELEIEYDEMDTTVFNQRYAEADETLKSRYTKLSNKLLSYDGMLCMITDSSAVFYKGKTVYARLDIRNERLCLYLATEPKKYVNTRYQSAISKRKGFEATPCLYRISTVFRQEGAYDMIEELSRTYGLIPKVQG